MMTWLSNGVISTVDFTKSRYYLGDTAKVQKGTAEGQERRETGVNYYHVDGTAEGQRGGRLVLIITTWMVQLRDREEGDWC
jgi:hypothetical protein